MGGVGPGLGSVGPVKNFFYVPPLGKIILIMCMLFGRLEIIPLIAVVSPSFWRK
jgi:trk system potassium uptake protein TrkH